MAEAPGGGRWPWGLGLCSCYTFPGAEFRGWHSCILSLEVISSSAQNHADDNAILLVGWQECLRSEEPMLDPHGQRVLPSLRI